MLPVTTAQEAYPIAERILAGVGATRVETAKGQAVVTLSIGIAETLFAPPGERLGDADAERDDGLPFSGLHASRADTCEDAFRDGVRLLRSRHRQHDDEFLAAIAPDHIRRPELGARRLRDVFKYLIAHGVPNV